MRAEVAGRDCLLPHIFPTPHPNSTDLPPPLPAPTPDAASKKYSGRNPNYRVKVFPHQKLKIPDLLALSYPNDGISSQFS